MTNRDARAGLIEILNIATRADDSICCVTSCEAELLKTAIEALKKVEAYERFIEYFVFEGGYGDYSAMCEYMTGHNDTWCSEHCGAEKPDLNCVIKWAEDDEDEK